MPLGFTGYNNTNSFLDYQKLDQAFQMQKAQAASQLASEGIDQQAKKLSLMGQIVGNNSVDQPSYERSKQVAASNGLDVSALPDQFNPDIVNHLRFAGATPTAQLSALIASQGHELRAGVATGNVGAYGYGSPGSGIGTTGTPTTTPAPPPATQTRGEPTDAQFNALFPPPPDNSPPAKPVVLTSPQAPQQNPGETTKNYQVRMANDPDQQGTLAASRQGGKDTVVQSDKLAADTKQAQNMLYSISTLKDAATKFQAGAMAPAKLSLMRVASAVGYPLDDDQVASMSNMQAFTKVANDIIGQAAKAEGQASRLQAAFQTIKQANPQIGLQPETLTILFDKMTAQANNIVDEQSTWNNQKTANNKLMFNDFERNYIADRSSQQRDMGGKLPSTQDTMGGIAPAAPKPGTTMQGTDGTYLFNGGDPSKQSSWKKVQ